MSLLQRFQEYAADFEKTYVDDDWSRLEPYFTVDAVYEVTGIPTFATDSRGRDAVFAYLQQVLNGFDRRCASRKLRLVAPPEVTDERVTLHWAATYEAPGTEPLDLFGTEEAVYEGDRIRHLKDTYTPEMCATFEAWMAANRHLFED